MKYFSHLNSAVEIIRLYDGKQPFHLFIKDFFNRDKKYGSKDRKNIARLCYSFFRMGQALTNFPVQEKMLVGLFICSGESNELLHHLKPNWDELADVSLEEKCLLAGISYSDLTLFPFLNELSNDIEKELFNLSHLQQPDVFIRIRPGYKKTVIKKIGQAEINYSLLTDSCIVIPGIAKIDNILDINKEAVVQDYSSQRISEFLQLIIKNPESPISVWDCCAASGGKSIMIKDKFDKIDLTVSDIRKSILINLKKRFTEADIGKYKSFIADLTNPVLPFQQNTFDLVIADVPCSGSGTWGRTPEQLLFFEEKTIVGYGSLQRKIVSNIIPSLKKGGYLLYITCSVFRKENEAVVQFIQEELHLELIKMEVLRGYAIKADTMFAALFIK